MLARSLSMKATFSIIRMIASKFIYANTGQLNQTNYQAHPLSNLLILTIKKQSIQKSVDCFVIYFFRHSLRRLI